MKEHVHGKHLPLCISAWARRLKTHVWGHPHEWTLRIAVLLYERGRHKVTAQRRPTSETGRNMTRTSTSTFAFHIGRDASSQMKYNVMPNSNCATPKYSTPGRNMTR